MLDKEEVGERIKCMRESRGYTREMLAERTGISCKFLYEIEMGKKGFSVEILLKISRELFVSCDYLLTGGNENVINIKNADAVLKGIDSKQIVRVKRIMNLILEILRDKDKKVNGAD